VQQYWPNWSQLNGLDWFLLVVITLSVLISLWRGFAREALSLAGWVLAFILANLFAGVLASFLSDIIANQTGRYIVAWAVLFVLTLVLAGITAKLVSHVMKVSGLGLLDRLLGTIFGFARGLLIIMALVFVVRQIVPPAEQQWLKESQLMPHIDILMDWSQMVFDEIKPESWSGIQV
jgi:membrane protein required for colicin V production